MKNKYGKRYFLYYSEEDKLFLNNYLETVFSNKQLTEKQKGYVIIAINGILKGESINELTYEKVMNNFSTWGDGRWKKYGLNFLYNLCCKSKINSYPLMRIVQCYELFKFSTKSASFEKLKYIFELDNKYWNLFLENKNNIPIKFRAAIVLYHLDETLFPNREIFDYISDKLEKIKYENNYNPRTILNNEHSFKTICYEILSYDQDKFSTEDFLIFVEKHTQIPLLFTVLKYFVDCNFIKNEIIKDVIVLISSIEPTVTVRPTIEKIKEIVDSKYPKLWHKTNNSPLHLYNCRDKKKLERLLNFSDINKIKSSVYSFFLCRFDESLSNPDSPLSFYTYEEQIKYFNNAVKSNKDKKKLMTYLHSFYSYYQTQETDLFTKDGYSSSLVGKIGISQAISRGFSIINYNKINTVPKEDKWILCFKELETSDYIEIKKVDFTIIENSIFRRWVKFYVWLYDAKISNKVISVSLYSLCLNYIQKLKTGDELSFFTTPNNNYDDINTKEIIALKTFIKAKYNNIDVQGGYIHAMKALLENVSLNELHKFEQGVFLELVTHKNFARNKANPIPEDDLIKLSNKLSELAKENAINHLYYIIFYIAIETEFRPQQIFDLQTDCIHNTAKKNEFVICSSTKTSYQETIEQAVTAYVKKCIDEAIKLTSIFRAENTNEGLRNILFIKPLLKKGVFGKFNHQNVNRYLNKVCKQIDIPNVTLCNLRDFHMTKAEELIIRKSLSDVNLKVLTGHKSTQTTISHYSKPSIQEMLEAVYGTIIGNVDIKGSITAQPNEDLVKNENLVSEKCGYCSSDSCNCFNNLDCLLCKSFVTTTDRKIYFEERIKILDYKIQEAKYEHDVSDLVAKKRLLIGYLNAIISLEEDLYENK